MSMFEKKSNSKMMDPINSIVLDNIKEMIKVVENNRYKLLTLNYQSNLKSSYIKLENCENEKLCTFFFENIEEFALDTEIENNLIVDKVIIAQDEVIFICTSGTIRVVSGKVFLKV